MVASIEVNKELVQFSRYDSSWHESGSRVE